MNASFALFKNNYKKTETHPDYKGKGTLEDGSEFEAAGWIRKDKNGNTFLSCKISPKREETQHHAPMISQKQETQKSFVPSDSEKAVKDARYAEADSMSDDLPF